MNVGVYFPEYSSDIGGGYTFEKDILNALIKVASQSRHQFTLFFEESRVNGTDFNVPNLQTVILEKEKPVSKFISLLIKTTARLGLRNNVTESLLQKKIREENIEFMWFVTPIYKLVEIPYIATVFDIQHRLQPWFPEVSTNGIWNYREDYYATYLRRAAFIITPNETGMRELSFFYQLPPERFRLLPHPVPSVEMPINSEDIQKVLGKYKIPPLYLLYPAQFWAHKNHVNLLLAYQILRTQYQINMDLVLVGSDKGNMQYVRDTAEKMSLKRHVHFLGFVPRSDLIALYRGAFALIYVSLFGPENLPPLEAFSCGCPVVTSDVAGFREQLGDAALQVDGYKPEEIALAIKRLIDDPALRKSLIEKGDKRATMYSSVDYVQDVFKIINDFEPIRRNWQ